MNTLNLDFLSSLPESPGVYRFYSESDRLLYVGKAKNLKKRVSSYFKVDQSLRVRHMVAHIARFEMTATQNEKEALLLESSLIKHLKPKYNVLLRDDKSYPYLWMSDDLYPRFSLYRGNRQEGGIFFGPYPSAHLVRTILDLLQRVFQLRSCSNSFFAGRKRPCLQYQLKRCTAPCCDYVTVADYAKQVSACRQTLQGDTQPAIQGLVNKMNHYAESYAYEQAAMVRDQIQSLQRLQQPQGIVAKDKHSADMVVLALQSMAACIGHIRIREGQVVECQNFLLSDSVYLEPSDLLERFLVQYYAAFDPISAPPIIYIEGLSPEFITLFEGIFQEEWHHKVIRLKPLPSKGAVSEWGRLARESAEKALLAEIERGNKHHMRWEDLKRLLHLPSEAETLVCFDISHALGEATVASCVMFENGKPLSALYRRFSLSIDTGDDYAAMKEALSAYAKLVQSESYPAADVVLIDGGKGQLTQAFEVLQSYDMLNVPIIGIAKGPHRRSLKETLWVFQPEVPLAMLELSNHAPAFHLLRYARDESHRVAIGAHRRQRVKKRVQSVLEGIPGIGKKRAKQLLDYFGGLQALQEANVSQIAQVPGISMELATRVYGALGAEKEKS